MEASITRRQEPREAVTVTAHTYCWENSLLESGRGDGGVGWAARGWWHRSGACFDLLPKVVLWTRRFPRPPPCTVPSEGGIVTAAAVLGF